MKLGLLLFLIGIYGLILNRKNLILMIISIELMLLAVTFIPYGPYQFNPNFMTDCWVSHGITMFTFYFPYYQARNGQRGPSSDASNAIAPMAPLT
jgi:hypothetical protein